MSMHSSNRRTLVSNGTINPANSSLTYPGATPRVKRPLERLSSTAVSSANFTGLYKVATRMSVVNPRVVVTAETAAKVRSGDGFQPSF